MRRRFFLVMIQGRDPLPNGGTQRLHRDWLDHGMPTMAVSGFVFLDDFDEENGATCVVPGTHRTDEPPDGPQPERIVVRGTAGDVLLLDDHVIHCATRNRSGRMRRALHAGFGAFENHHLHRETRDFSEASADERYLMGVGE